MDNAIKVHKSVITPVILSNSSSGSNTGMLYFFSSLVFSCTISDFSIFSVFRDIAMTFLFETSSRTFIYFSSGSIGYSGNPS